MVVGSVDLWAETLVVRRAATRDCSMAAELDACSAESMVDTLAEQMVARTAGLKAERTVEWTGQRKAARKVDWSEPLSVRRWAFVQVARRARLKAGLMAGRSVVSTESSKAAMRAARSAARMVESLDRHLEN